MQMIIQKIAFFCVKSVSEHIYMFIIWDQKHKKSQKANRKVGRGGVNAYGQHVKYPSFFDDFPNMTSIFIHTPSKALQIFNLDGSYGLLRQLGHSQFVPFK